MTALTIEQTQPAEQKPTLVGEKTSFYFWSEKSEQITDKDWGCISAH